MRHRAAVGVQQVEARKLAQVRRLAAHRCARAQLREHVALAILERHEDDGADVLHAAHVLERGVPVAACAAGLRARRHRRTPPPRSSRARASAACRRSRKAPAVDADMTAAKITTAITSESRNRIDRRNGTAKVVMVFAALFPRAKVSHNRCSARLTTAGFLGERPRIRQTL